MATMTVINCCFYRKWVLLIAIVLCLARGQNFAFQTSISSRESTARYPSAFHLQRSSSNSPPTQDCKGTGRGAAFSLYMTTGSTDDDEYDDSMLRKIRVAFRNKVKRSKLRSGDKDGLPIGSKLKDAFEKFKNYLQSDDLVKTTVDKFKSYFRNEDTATEPSVNADSKEYADEPLASATVQDTTSISVQTDEAVTIEVKPSAEDDSPTMSADVAIQGDRWAVAGRNVDISGLWEMGSFAVTEKFKQNYDRYLMLLGQPLLVRSIAVSIVGMTTEEITQKDSGREVEINGHNLRGNWKRILVSSGADGKNKDFKPIRTPIVTADSEQVEAEAWWENGGTVHRSWLRGVKKYGGGDFESKRYLEQGGKVLVCESTFHPTDETREKAKVTWRFLRHGEKL